MSVHVLAVAMLLATGASPTEPRTPSLQQALRRATAVVFGQVERLETYRGRPTATMRVEHAARGTLAGSITFFADPIGEFQPSAVVGRRALVFLEPSGQEALPLKIAFNGTGVLAAFDHGGERYLAMSQYDGLRFPKKLCTRVKYGRYECTAQLTAVLKQAGLPPLPTPPSQPATFRVVARQCGSCELQDWVERSSAPGTIDCTSKGDRHGAADCARQAMAAKKPFKAVLRKQGIDSTIVDATVFDGERAHELHYDSSIEGGGDCAARVGRRLCQTLAVADDEDDWLRCAGSEPDEVLCSQHDERVEFLGPPEDVSQLRCERPDKEGNYRACELRPGPLRDGEVIPPAAGRSLVCRRWASMPTHFSCHVD